MAEMPPKLSIVVPAFNEAARLELSLRKIVEYLREMRGPSELLLVDDGSQDDTAAIAEKVARDSAPVPTR
jgi:glycosyltransferase involved in cell wall biosynthesis